MISSRPVSCSMVLRPARRSQTTLPMPYYALPSNAGSKFIGEALNQMLKREPALAPRLSDHRRIIAFHNCLIHGYADIDDEVVWGVLTTSLPRLRREIVILLPDNEAI